MDRLIRDFTRDWAALNAELTAELPALLQTFLEDLAQPDARTIERAVASGKKLRGCLVLAVCDALGAPIASAMRSALAVECVHAASLIHDDLVDGDWTRRSEPAIWVMQGSRRAVLLGDVIFATALHRAAQIGKDEVLVLSRAIALVAAGAYQEHVDARDIEQAVSDGSIGAELYDRVIQLKTGALFAAAAELGAIASGASATLRHASAEFGARMGQAYQIADDLQDVLGYIDSPAITRQQRALLAGFLASFNMAAAAQTALRTSDPPSPAGYVRELIDTMEAEIARRIALARRALAGLPERSRVALLQAIPSLVVEPFVRAARGAHPALASHDVRACEP
jgi:geranylgeranyl pyrophosphate synthase